MFSETLNVSSNDPADTAGHDITLLGQGVGPDFSAVSNVDFGEVDADAVSDILISLHNITTDGDLGALTDLTLNNIIIGGDDAALFALNNFTPGQTITAGELFMLGVDYIGNGSLGVRQAFLTIETDQGTLLAGDGNDFQIDLTATAIPEPSTAATMLIITGLLAMRRRLDLR